MIPNDWKTLQQGTNVTWLQDRDASNILEGAIGLKIGSTLTGANEFIAMVRRTGSFSVKVQDALAAVWVAAGQLMVNPSGGPPPPPPPPPNRPRTAARGRRAQCPTRPK